MKKVVLALAVIATVACMASCNKNCTCTTYLDDEVLSTTEDIDLKGSEYKNCDEFAKAANAAWNGEMLIDNGKKTGTECE